MKGLSARQTKTLAVLLQTDSYSEVSRQTGVPWTTLHRWLKSPVFMAEFDKARANILTGTVEKLSNLSAQAVDTLERNLQAESGAIQVKAAATVLNLTFRGHELLALARKIEELETLLQNKEGPSCRLRAV